jgi:hypothetical protein
MVQALARAHRWKSLLDADRYAAAQDAAGVEKINLP